MSRPFALSALHIELTYDSVGNLRGVELPGSGKLDNPDCDKFSDRRSSRSGESQVGADLLESPMHRIDLVRMKWGSRGLGMYRRRDGKARYAPRWTRACKSSIL
jgi:hypothetical protein